MLKSLMIRNFAIIDEVQIEFQENMSVLTGETGAGKSIIIDAISLLMGVRATSFMVKTGEKKAFIEGVFDISKLDAVSRKLDELGFEMEDELVISREISAEGKSQARLNYRSVPASLLKEIGAGLADIHSQFETQYLLNDKIHLQLLDQYIGKNMDMLLTSYRQLYQDYSEKKKAYQALLQAPSDEEQIDFYRTKMLEIDDADLKEGEIEQLEQEKKRMSQYEKINEKLSTVLYYLKGDNGALDNLYQADHTFSQIDDPELSELQEKLSEGYYTLSDIADEISGYKDDLVFDEYRYDEIQNRLFLIRKLQRQYGYEVSDILKKRDEFAQKIEWIENKEAMLLKMEKDLKSSEEKAAEAALKIRAKRYEYAKKLEKAILKQLKDLYMENTVFSCAFEKNSNLNDLGLDSMSFMISTNAGQSLHRLSDVASGGELSRLMLGMKCIFTQLEGVSTVIFDEVDTGVSGKVATAIGRKMKEISKNVQVICITHLPQVASFANHHLFVYKHLVRQKTKTDTKWLTENERIQEIAKMLSNDTVNETALENAKYLILENGKK